MSAHLAIKPLTLSPAAAGPTFATPRERAELALRVQLNHLLITRAELRRTRHAVPAQLEAAIRDNRGSLGLEACASGGQYA